MKPEVENYKRKVLEKSTRRKEEVMMTTTIELKWKEICGMNVNVK
jgi:hypothetical protein